MGSQGMLAPPSYSCWGSPPAAPGVAPAAREQWFRRRANPLRLEKKLGDIW